MPAVGVIYREFPTPWGNVNIPIIQYDYAVVADVTVPIDFNDKLYEQYVTLIVNPSGPQSPFPVLADGGFIVAGDIENYIVYRDNKAIKVKGENSGNEFVVANASSSTYVGSHPILSMDANGLIFNVANRASTFSSFTVKRACTNTEWGFVYDPNETWTRSGSTSISAALLATYQDFFNSWYGQSPEPPEDPYEGAGDSEPVAFPHGDFDYGSDPIGGADRFHIPSVSVVDTGFVTLYNPTIQELKALSNYLWSSTFDIDTFKKIFNNPMDLFIGLSMIPVRVPQGPSKEVGIGMVGSGVYMTTASAQIVIVNCGVCDVPNFSGGYLDYSPYTKVEIYLPYIGFRTLNADEVMGKSLHVQYKVDILSGACTCWIDVLTTIADGTTELCTTYVFMGECAVSIPLASGDWTNLLNGIIGAAAAVGAGFAAGGAGGAIAGGVSAASSVAVNDSKIHVERSGAITSSAGLMAPQSPFLIISTPHIHKPAEVPYYTGYPAYFTSVLGDLSGFTIIDNIHLSNVPATEPELEEIETLLKGGVIL